MAFGHMRYSPSAREIPIQKGFDLLEEFDLILIEPVGRQFDFDKEETFLAVNHKQVRWLWMCLADKVCRFRAENLNSFEVARTAPSLSPVVARNFITEIAVADSGEQLAKAVSLTFQRRVSDRNLFGCCFDCSIFEEDCGMTVFSLPSRIQKAI